MTGDGEGELELSRVDSSTPFFLLCERANLNPHALQRLFFPRFPSDGPLLHSGLSVVPQDSHAFAPAFNGRGFGSAKSGC